MGQQFADHFAKIASAYAGFRPTYPPELFTWLVEIVPARDTAWDCACGNGQASLDLATHFARVVATDASPAQIASAPSHPRIEFRVAPAEDSGLPAASVDLVTVAQGLHWFDLDRFYAEVRRVLRPRGVLAAWTYGIVNLEGADVDAAVQEFRCDIVGPYWPPERKHVDSGYRALSFPFAELPAPAFQMQARWTLPEILGYLRTWSSTARFVSARGYDPVSALEQRLLPVWGQALATRNITWPLSLPVARL
jgi:SAM-dependent methyltransferase